MAKQFFKDLPDTTTPITASRLNGLLDGEEALGNLVVDSIRSKNMFNKNASLLGYYLNNTGAIDVANTYAVSDFIPVIPGGKYTYQGTTIGEEYGSKMGYYNSSKTWVSYADIVNGGTTITIPANVYYIRTTVRLTELDTYQFEPGEVATPYFPYQDLTGMTNIVSLMNYTGITQGTEYTLNDDIYNYKYLIVQLSTASNDANSSKQYIPTQFITSFDNTRRVAISLFQSSSVYYFGDFYFSASNKIYCSGYTHNSWNVYLKVWGIK